MSAFTIVGKFHYVYICRKCSKPIIVTDNSEPISNCISCNSSQRATATNKYVVGADELVDGIFTIDYKKIIELFPLLQRNMDVFEIDEKHITTELLSTSNNDTNKVSIYLA